MDFNQVNYDGDLEDLEEEQLRSTIEEFEKAQEENVAEFEAAKERLNELTGDDDATFEDVLGEVQDFADAKDELVDEVIEYDSFEEFPITEDELRAAEFSKVRAWHARFAELEAADEADEDDSNVSDFGKRAPTEPEGNEDPDEQFAERHLGGMPGFQKE